jgi:hypothetical protein
VANIEYLSFFTLPDLKKFMLIEVQVVFAQMHPFTWPQTGRIDGHQHILSFGFEYIADCCMRHVLK